MGSCRRHDYDIPNRLELLSGAVKIAAIRQGCAGRVRQQNHCCDEHPAHRAIRTNRRGCVNAAGFYAMMKCRLRAREFRETFPLRQGLWTEDLRTPPGQECSNGSLILFAVVLWRTFLPNEWRTGMKVLEDEDDSVRGGRGESRQAGSLHALAKTENGSPSAIALEEQSHHDDSAERKRNRLRTGRFREEKGARYLAFPKSLKRFMSERVMGINWELVQE